MYEVALLIERQLNALDVDQVISLHEGLDDDVTYHLLLPVESSAALLASSLSSLGGGQILPADDPDMLTRIQDEIVTSGQRELDASAELLREHGQKVTALLTDDDPVSALETLVAHTSTVEVIVLTEPHVIQEFFHVDWTSRARRKLNVPTLHLLEHVPFDAQT